MKKEKKYGLIDVTRVFKGEYNHTNTITAELRQTVETITYYPKTKIQSSLQDNIFAETEFEIEHVPFTRKEHRQAWIDVPPGTTVEDMEFRLLSFQDARIYKILSNYPILTDEEEALLLANPITMSREEFAHRQVVRHGETSKTPYQLILDKFGKLQYRRLLFSKTAKEDVDLRNNSSNDMFTTPYLIAEINGKVYLEENQKI